MMGNFAVGFNCGVLFIIGLLAFGVFYESETKGNVRNGEEGH